ncbi:MAG TPA: alanine racemase [Patescibacteria group bacterium]|nr:alanine racemase [Patescibacteria group bacterium]
MGGNGMMTPLSTPALIVDLDVFESNVAAMAKMLEGTAKTVRPHFKTHRTPALAQRQLGGAAVGITCATVGEAEAAAAAGIADILIANEVVDPAKLDRVVELARRCTLAVAVDSSEPVEALSGRASAAGVTVQVLIDVDTKLHRCGVDSPGEALRLAEVITRAPGIVLAGVMGYEGRMRLDVDHRSDTISQAYATLAEVREALSGAGFPVGVVSAAGTSTLREAIADPFITEIQAGVYALMEPQLLDLGLPFRCAAVLRGTVISRHPNRVVVDVGRRTAGMEYGPPLPAGFSAGPITVGDEHMTVPMTGRIPALGSTLDFVPGQIRTTFNLHDRVWVTRGGQPVDCWPVSARGSSQ